jgi:hypothetical protein
VLSEEELDEEASTQRRTLVANKPEDPTLLSALQDLLIFQMAAFGVPQNQIRSAVGVGINRVNRIAKVAKKRKTKEK